jgi:hypothetical protein
MEHARAAGEVEPRVLRLREVGEPPRAGIAAREAPDELVLVLGVRDLLRHAELDRQARKPAELVVGSQNEDVDRRHHRRDGLVRDVRKGLSAPLVEREVRRVAEMEELEVILEDSIHPFEQAVVRAK